MTQACVWVDTGGGETLPAEGGGDDVAADETDAAGKTALDSGGARRVLELGQSPASADETVPGSCSPAGGSRVLDRSIRSCLILLKACWRVPDGADRERPNAIQGARTK